jgi:hypothetical protein
VSARISSVVRVTAKGHRFSVGFSEIKDSLQRRRTSENAQKAKFTTACRSASDRPEEPGFLR